MGFMSCTSQIKGMQGRWRIGFFAVIDYYLSLTWKVHCKAFLQGGGVTDMKNDESFPVTGTSELLASVSNNPAVANLQELRVTSVAASRQWRSSLMFYKQKCGAQWAGQHRESIFHSVTAVFLFFFFFFKSSTSKISYQGIVVKTTNTPVSVDMGYFWVL